jgi:hypothetical protein
MRHRFVAIVASACLVSGGSMAAVVGSATRAAADTQGPIGFDGGYTLGSVNGQNGWSSTGGFDEEVVDNSTFPFAPAAFGGRSFRISDAVTSGGFVNQTFTPSTTDAAGEPGADAGGYPTGTLQNNFGASFNFASTKGAVYQPGLNISVSPDRGDGARMSYVRIEDSPTGWQVFFDDYVDAAPFGSGGNLDDGCGVEDGFTDTHIATDLDKSVAHNLRISIKFLPGPHNDIVHVLIDGALAASGTSWEDYFRYCPAFGGGTGGALADQSRIVRNLELREDGAADPLNDGQGFLFDAVTLVTNDDCTSFCYVDGNLGDDAGSGRPGDALRTIQAGVNMVTAGGFVNVGAGTYDASTTIPKAVTLFGANAGIHGNGARVAESLVERLAAQSGSAFNITTADPVVIDGFRAQFNGSDAVGGVLNSLVSGNQLTFRNNLVDNSTYTNVLVNATSSATLTFTGNKFTGIEQTGAGGTGVVAAWGATGTGVQAAVTFTGNRFTALTDDDGVPAINFNTVKGTVSGSTFQNIHQYGILLADKLGPMWIHDNLFDTIVNDTPGTSDSRGSGVRTFGQPTFVAPVTISHNTFANSWHGVRVANDGSPADISNGNLKVIRNNVKTNNTDAGISVADGTIGSLNGTCNFWGQNTGPAPAQKEGTVTTTPYLTTSNLGGACPSLPGAPATVGAVPYNDHGAKVVWSAPANTGGSPVLGYRIIPYKAGVAQPPVITTGTATTKLISGLTDGASYRFTVAARNVVGYGLPSAKSAAMIAGAPGQPAAPTVTKPAPGSLQNTFAAPMNNGAPITSYSVTCRSSNGGVTKSQTGAASPITVTGLSVTKTYTCRVKATNSRGTGPLSDPSAPIIA